MMPAKDRTPALESVTPVGRVPLLSVNVTAPMLLVVVKDWLNATLTVPLFVAGLKALGHDVEMLPDFDETVGHAGAIVRHPNGAFEGGADPRSNGGVAGF